MEYNITYEPDNFRGFNDESHLKNFLNYLFRTDITQKWTCPYTRNNIYMLRGEDGKLEYFTNVVENYQRIELKRAVLNSLKGINLKKLFNDVAYVSPNIPKSDAQEMLDDIIHENLVKVWHGLCPFDGMQDEFFDSTICLVLHADQSYDGDALQFHIHRIYSIK